MLICQQNEAVRSGYLVYGGHEPYVITPHIRTGRSLQTDDTLGQRTHR